MTNNLQTIPIQSIKRPKISLRPVRRNSPEYAELTESIRKDGVLQPVLVRPYYCVGCQHKECIKEACECRKENVDFDMVEGWHRLEASKEAGRVDIPVMIREMSDNEVLIFQIKCNAIRPKTATFEYARRLKKLMESGYTLNQLSALIDKNQKWIRDQLQLNRLCEDARAPVERGEIRMSSALALANLPEDLQTKFIDDAISMKPGEFNERAKAALRDFKTFLLNEQQKNREIGATTVPTLRAINVLKREAVKPKEARTILKAMKAKTAIDGWNAALAWVFKLDPISVEKRKAGYQEKENDEAVATQEEFRTLNREMIRKFVIPQSESGDYRNGK